MDKYKGIGPGLVKVKIKTSLKDITMTEFIAGTAIIFLASLLQSTTGFGFSLMATPLLLLFFNPRDAIQINIVVSLFNSMVLTTQIWREVDRGLLWRLTSGSILGIPLGALLFYFLNTGLLKLAVSFVVLLLTALLLYRDFRAAKTAATDPAKKTSLSGDESTGCGSRGSKQREVLVGLCAGALTTSLGMPGPPLLLYFNSVNLPKELLRSTTQAFFIFVYGISYLMQALTVHTSGYVLAVSLRFIPATVAGIVLGLWLFRLISQSLFKALTYAILIFTGLYMIFTTLATTIS